MRRASRALLVIAIIVLVAGPMFVFAYHFFLEGLLAPKVQVIQVYGVISTHGYGNSETIANQIRAADSDPAVKAIMLEINSPGGYVVATEEISRAVEGCNKPVVAWIRVMGASGAYWIASSADLIVAERASSTGSIGVTSSYLQYARYLEEEGITYERLVSGRYKDTGSPYKDLASDERALLQSKIETINDMFVLHISRTREMDEGEVRLLATGEIFLGIEALEVGLVDMIGGKQEAFEAAKELSGASGAELSETGGFSFL